MKLLPSSAFQLKEKPGSDPLTSSLDQAVKLTMRDDAMSATGM